jgi:acyl carrier protein
MLDVTALSAKDRVADIVHDILERRGAGRTVGADDDLRESGLTSLDMVNLMLAVETEFDLRIPDGEMTPQNFRTIGTIDALVIALTHSKR